jgi:3-isopropylmalate/(R)-2-methylmalate dehydratase small subunit
VLPDDAVAELGAAVDADPAQQITVDLERQTITCGERRYSFAIDPVSRNQLINGWDDVDLTESYRDRIAAFKETSRQQRPWAAPAAPAARP